MMLDWLKNILGDAYNEDIDKKVSAEIGKNFVAKSDFDSLNAEKKSLTENIKERDKQLEELKATSGNVDALKQQIEKLQADNKSKDAAHALEIKQLKINAAVDKALSDAKARNAKAVKALLDLEKAELSDDGTTVKGLDEQIKNLTAAPDSAFLFDAASSKNSFSGFRPGESSDKSSPLSKDPKDMNYDELCSYFDEKSN